MLKRFFEGLALGVGCLIVISFFTSLYNIDSSITQHTKQAPDKVIEPTSPKPIKEPYYGPEAIYRDRFDLNNAKQLSEGTAKYTGTVTTHDQPIVGLRLRLALNGYLKSQWAITDEKGHYHISIPAGEYYVNGHELDTEVANDLLSGFIALSKKQWFGSLFTVEKNKTFTGPTLYFAKPIVKQTGNKAFKLTDDITVSWHKYPNATNYNVQLFEVAANDKYTIIPLFKTNIETNETSLDIKKHTDKLKEGFNYHFQINAFNQNAEQISKTHLDHHKFDFTIIPPSKSSKPINKIGIQPHIDSEHKKPNK